MFRPIEEKCIVSFSRRFLVIIHRIESLNLIFDLSVISNADILCAHLCVSLQISKFSLTASPISIVLWKCTFSIVSLL